MVKINPNTKTKTPHTERAAQVRNALKAEEANFTERINKAYRSETLNSKDPNCTSKEIVYDKEGNKLYGKSVFKDGSVHYYMNDANNNGRTFFVDLDDDGKMDKMSHCNKETTKRDFRTVDKNDDGTFDMIYW